jgi:hypothetical protein
VWRGTPAGEPHLHEFYRPGVCCQVEEAAVEVEVDLLLSKPAGVGGWSGRQHMHTGLPAAANAAQLQACLHPGLGHDCARGYHLMHQLYVISSYYRVLCCEQLNQA